MPIALRFIISSLVIVFDQITKLVVDNTLTLYDQVAVMPMFNITLLYNKGAAFSFLNDAGGWQRWLFTGISAVVSVVLIVWLWRLSRDEKWMTLSLALILGGAIGNLIDRVAYGHVVDFIQWYYDKWYFPAFNIADSAIFVGAALLLVITLFTPNEPATPD